MITLARGLVRAANWRLLLLFVLAMAVPSVIALLPLHAALARLLDANPHAAAWARALDSLALTDLVKQLANSSGNGLLLTIGAAGGLLVTVVVAPLLASFALAAAGAGRLTLRQLLGDSGALYGRLLRFVPFSFVPIDLFAGGGALLFKLAGDVNEKAVTEHAATMANRAALIGFVVLFIIGQTIADAGRALFVAEPARRSAFLAMLAGWKLVFRRPLRALFIGYGSWLFALGLAALLLAARLRIGEAGTVGVLKAFAVGQAAVAALGWGRTARLVALVKLAQYDIEMRPRPIKHDPRPDPVIPPVEIAIS